MYQSILILSLIGLNGWAQSTKESNVLTYQCSFPYFGYDVRDIDTEAARTRVFEVVAKKCGYVETSIPPLIRRYISYHYSIGQRGEGKTADVHTFCIQDVDQMRETQCSRKVIHAERD